MAVAVGGEMLEVAESATAVELVWWPGWNSKFPEESCQLGRTGFAEKQIEAGGMPETAAALPWHVQELKCSGSSSLLLGQAHNGK